MSDSSPACHPNLARLSLVLASLLWAAIPMLAAGGEGLVPPAHTTGNGTGIESLTPPSNAFVVASGRQLDLRKGEAVTLLTTLPFPATETILIKDLAGTVVRTIVAQHRDAGSYSDAWDGRTESGGRLKDGQYRWVAVIEGEGRTLLLDDSRILDGDYEAKSHPEYEPWDPFNNAPLRISAPFERPGEVLIVFSRATFRVLPRCDPPDYYCRWLDGYQPAGDFHYEWAGVDDTGAYRPDLHGVLVISSHENLSRNAIVVVGGSPTVTHVAISPSQFRPYDGTQTVVFDLGLLSNEKASASISWTHQGSLSTLRTLQLVDVVAGNATASWDGRADNGVLVAPGRYTVRVRVSDGRGQKATGEILTTVMY